MITGSLSHWSQERAYAHPVLRKAIDFLHESDFTLLEEGRHPIWGDDMFALISTFRTRPASEPPAEKHERFLDIHYVIEGEETIGWKVRDEQTLPFKSHPEDDYSLYSGLEGESMISLASGRYAVLFPEDIHRPGLTETEPVEVRKVVIKINRELF